MPYSDSFGDNVRLIRSTLTRITDLSGRSRRLEIVLYLVASAVVGVVSQIGLGVLVSNDASRQFDTAFEIAVLAGMIALFVRRVHDQGLSGWWGGLLPLLLGLSIPTYIAELGGNIGESIAWKTSAAGIAAALCGISIFILCMMPGTEGDNRYGPDPRLEVD